MSSTKNRMIILVTFKMENFPTGISEGMQRISESVFGGLCLKLGTSQQVAIRRDMTDFEEMVISHIEKYGVDKMWIKLSGSKKEGFRVEGSDIDIMIWPKKFQVITDVSQSVYYDTSNTSLFLADGSESPPGFALLKVLTPTTDFTELYTFAVNINDSLFLSCSILKEKLCSIDPLIFNVHGPCAAGFFNGTAFDIAVCFVCDFWPSSASSWIERCHSWPDHDTVDDIVRGGCHFVAIGHPIGQHINLEWRISFSQAEQKCVYAMNHCQFLIYGLLKVFLKEVINQEHEESNELLCSYHIKTAVLWAIQQNTLTHWCPQNLLDGFWVCFKLLLQWVYEGVCPNFFIPANNLFLSKIYGSAQKSLFLKLHELYKKGLFCLLQSSSIRSYIIDVFYNPRISISTNEDAICCEVDRDKEFLNAVDFHYKFLETHQRKYVKALYIVEQLIHICSHLTQYQVNHLQRLSVSFLQNTAASVLQKMNNLSCLNKHMYIADKISCRMLKLAAKFGCVSDMLHIALFYYKTCRYRKALSVLETTKSKLVCPFVMYNGHVNREMYLEAVGGQSWSTKKREAVACDIKLHNRTFYINELEPVQKSVRLFNDCELEIPVFVFLHFLEFLCYRHIDRRLSQAALDELQVLVQYGQEPYIPKTRREISLQILGICQQITGNL